MHSEISAISFENVKIKDKFWQPKIKVHRQVTLETCLDKCESTGRISNFSKAAGLMEGEFQGIYFNDSDLYKVIEGVAYSLMDKADSELEEKVDGIIEKIAAAQEDNGYLLCYYTLVEPEKRWTEMGMHEMYCGGHLMEAAVAYKRATGKNKLLSVACKLADHYLEVFGPGKRHWVTGHQEVELALVKLYEETGREKYLNFAKWLLEERGHGYGVGEIWDKEDWGPGYCQDDKAAKDLEVVSGHAVRAMYQYTGMADVDSKTSKGDYVHALNRLWENVVFKNMYITGGIGPSKDNEGFTKDYDLPNKDAYCETCASIGMVFWNHRMNLLHGETKYVDVLERAMYNGALAGVSLSGDHFFYVNPLASDGNHHREEWYDCSCCPTQIARFIPSIGSYIYNVSKEGIWVNLYIASESSFEYAGEKMRLNQTTNYPWNGNVHITIDTSIAKAFEMNLRMPGWCKSSTLAINGKTYKEITMDKGYIKIRRQWQKGDEISIDFHMPVERVYSHPEVAANKGKVAIQKGPMVYCLEAVDNQMELKNVQLLPNSKFIVEHMEDLLGGVDVLKTISIEGAEYIFVPYYSWDNRQPGWMMVWVDEGKPQEPLPLYSM